MTSRPTFFRCSAFRQRANCAHETPPPAIGTLDPAPPVKANLASLRLCVFALNPLLAFPARTVRRALALAVLLTGATLLSPPVAPAATDTLLDQFRAGPMAGVDDIIFAARKVNETDGHWYANLGYYAHDPQRKAWREGTKLYRLSLATGKLATLLDDPRGGVRDPQVHYDGSQILFSYREGDADEDHGGGARADGAEVRAQGAFAGGCRRRCAHGGDSAECGLCD